MRNLTYAAVALTLVLGFGMPVPVTLDHAAPDRAEAAGQPDEAHTLTVARETASNPRAL
ncbi:MAG: hypothetical protein WAT09_18815 [Paracoccaceae bacterium]